MTSLRYIIRTVLTHVAIINYGKTNSADADVGEARNEKRETSTVSDRRAL